MFKNKDDIVIERKAYGVYDVEFSLTNDNNVNIRNIINIDFMKIVYQLNKDLINDIKINKKDECNGELYLKFRHLFEDLGFPQFYSTMKLKIDRKENEVYFSAKSDEVEIEFERDDEIIKGPKFNMECKIACPNETKLELKMRIILDWDNIPLTDFLEKICIKITKKIVNRIRGFVSNLIIEMNI